MINIQRFYQHDCTLGRLSLGDFQCFTLELPDLDNQQNISCIPAGTYKAKKYNSPSKGLCLLLEGVPNRTYIEVHSGNFTRQIQGCILVGDSIKFIDNDSIPDVSNSKATLNKLLSLLPNETTITLE